MSEQQRDGNFPASDWPFGNRYPLLNEAHAAVHQATTHAVEASAANSSGIPTDAAARKAIPIASGFIDYFPRAIAAVAELSRIGNDQHNPGKPLHWDRSKSGDESDAMMRHFIERGTVDTDGVRHSTKNAWRAMALLEKELEEVANAALDNN